MKPGPTKVGLVTMRFHCFFCLLPERMTLNISSSAMGLTCNKNSPVGKWACTQQTKQFLPQEIVSYISLGIKTYRQDCAPVVIHISDSHLW